MPILSRSAPKSLKQKRMRDVMSRFSMGELKSSSGHIVTSRKQAIAIGLHESGQSRNASRKLARKRSRR